MSTANITITFLQHLTVCLACEPLWFAQVRSCCLTECAKLTFCHLKDKRPQNEAQSRRTELRYGMKTFLEWQLCCSRSCQKDRRPKKKTKKPTNQTKTSSTNLNNKCHFMPHSIPSACSSSTKISFLVLWERQSRQQEYSFLLWAYTLFSSATQWAELWLELCLLGYLKIYMHVFLLQFTYIYTIQHMGRQVVQ